MSTASTAVTLPRLPSITEMEEQMRDRLPGLVVYNPSDEWRQLHVYGLTHLWACPDLGGAVEPHPITRVPTVCDGRSVIRGRFLKQKDSSGKIIEGQDASSMVKFIVSPENYGELGFVWLPGISPEDDRKLIDTSKKVYLAFQRSKDEMVVSKRSEFKANWEKGGLHKGIPCPPPTPTETAAMDRLQERKRAATYLYECEVVDCPGYAVNEWERFAAHMKAAHDVVVERAKYDGDGVGLALKPTGIAAAAAAVVSQSVKGEGEEKEKGEEKDDTTQSSSELDRPQKKSSSSSRK